MDAAKKEILRLYFENVHGKKPDLSCYNQSHDGRSGHWLEHQFGITANRDNNADLLGYELKNETIGKTSFGDWSANEYIFKKEDFKNIFSSSSVIVNRDKFLHIFGNANNPKHLGRYSWSGTPCPKIGHYNDFGQILLIDINKDIIASYSYSKDLRRDKSVIVPDELQIDNLELARWYGHDIPHGIKGKTIKEKLNDKFNQKGWFTCKTNHYGEYCEICFGKPINYETWLDLVRQGIVFFDSGMHEGNDRPYSQWRANNNLWDSLITERYNEFILDL